MSATVHHGDVFDVLPTLPPGGFDVAVTSPPYWKLRQYLPAGHPDKARELGGEDTPAAYVETMVRVCRLVRAALADHAVFFLNCGDSYSSKPARKDEPNLPDEMATRTTGTLNKVYQNRAVAEDIPAGNLCLIPQRLAIALQDDGWYVRSIICWHKPSPMPSSVSGWAWKRCRVKVRAKALTGTRKVPHAPQHSNGVPLPGAASQWSDCPGCKKCDPHGGYVLRRGSWRPTSAWEPVLMLAKSPDYFCDSVAVQEPAAAATLGRNAYSRVIDDPDEQFAVKHDHETVLSTANPRDVWTIAAEPLHEAHYAAMPSELVHRCLKAATSARGYCPACGAPWVRVVDGEWVKNANGLGIGTETKDLQIHRRGSTSSMITGGQVVQETIGWRPSCACPPAEPRPGRVLDPFAGSGRVGLEAARMGLDFTGVELNEQYVTLSRRLLADQLGMFA